MISQLASVFSSQGVVLPDTELVPVPGTRQSADQAAAESTRGAFAAKFDQAATKLELSRQALKAAEEAGRNKGAASGEEMDVQSIGSGAEDAGAESETGKAESGTRLSAPGIGELTPEEEKIVGKLKERDREVRSHEQSHIAASGGHAQGGAHYEFKTGPDGRQYAVGGHVNIDVSPVSGNPQATLQKAMAVRRAATAPGEPSGADMAVASAAAEMARQAAKEISSKSAGAGDEVRRNPYAAYGANISSDRSGAGRAGTGRFVNTLA